MKIGLYFKIGNLYFESSPNNKKSIYHKCQILELVTYAITIPLKEAYFSVFTNRKPSKASIILP